MVKSDIVHHSELKMLEIDGIITY